MFKITYHTDDTYNALDFAALLEFSDFDITKTHPTMKNAIAAAMRACTDVAIAIVLDLADDANVVRHRIDVDMERENITLVHLIDHADDGVNYLLSLRIFDVDANDANDES